jgi:hypothetical protein
MSNDEKTLDKFPRKQVLPDGTVFTAYGVRTTSAPPPIKPMGPCATVRKSVPPSTHRPAVPVDWSFWPASRRVKQDEAIALSLGLDPHSLYNNTDGHINPEFCPDNATAILFLKRLNLLAASNSRTNILLSEIAAWASFINLTPIPSELEALAREKPNAPEKTDKPASAENNDAKKVDARNTATTKDVKPKQDAREIPPHVTTHRVPQPKRTNILDSVIEEAKSTAVCKTDWQSVWASLVKLAQTTERPAPLLGFSDDEGVKYQDFSEVKFLTKKNFHQRWNRANTAR